jgi:hypothetical protein
MSSKGLVITTIGNILVVVAIILLTLTGLFGSSFEVESMQKSGLTLSLENSAYMWTGALEESAKIIAMRSAYDIARTGGTYGSEIATWYVNGPDVMDLKANLEDIIVERLPAGSLNAGLPVSFDEGFIDISEYDGSCGPIQSSTCFHIDGEKEFSIADETIEAAVNLEPYRFNLDAKSNYFSLVYAGRAIMEEEQFSSLLDTGSIGTLVSRFKGDSRFSSLEIEADVSVDFIEFALWDESCIGTDSYYCLTPLTASDEGITVDGEEIPYDFTKLIFRVDTQNLQAPPTLRYVFRVKEGYGRVCVSKGESTVCTIGSRQVRFEELEDIQVSATPKSDFVKFVGLWNSQEVTISSRDDASIPDPSSPPVFPAQYDESFVDGYFQTCQPVVCLPGSCGPVSNGCGRTLNCGSCSGGNWWCDYDVSMCKCTPDTCESLGKECGSWSDGCDGTLYCGSCTSDRPTCNSNGQCECIPSWAKTSESACNNEKKTVYYSDGCGNTRTETQPCGEKCPTGCQNGNKYTGQKRSDGSCEFKICAYGCDSQGSSCVLGYKCDYASAECRTCAWPIGNCGDGKAVYDSDKCYAPGAIDAVLATATCVCQGPFFSWTGVAKVVSTCSACNFANRENECAVSGQCMTGCKLANCHQDSSCQFL